MTGNTTTRDYQSFFDPQAYFDKNYDHPKKDEYVLEKMVDFWTHVVKNSASSMLEYGAGPIISRLITASKHVQSIIAAEYLEANRKAMEDWITRDPKAFNWRPTFDYVVQKMEGMSPEEVDKREVEVREKIKAVVPCDIKSQNPLQIPRDISAKYGPPFDVVSTCFCIEAVVESEKEYKDHVAYLTGLIRPGGYLIMHGVVREKFYTVGDKTFYSFPLTKELVLESMKDAGLKNIVFDSVSSHLRRAEFADLSVIVDLKAGMKDHFSVYGQV